MGMNNEERKEHFFNWVAGRVSSAILSELYQAFLDLEDDLSSGRYSRRLSLPLIEITDPTRIEQLKNDLGRDVRFRRSLRSTMKLTMLSNYAIYLRTFPPAAANEGQAKVNDNSGDADTMSRNRCAFSEWLRKRGFSKESITYICSTVDMIHALIRKDANELGLFGISDDSSFRRCVDAVRREPSFLRGDRMEQQLWTHALDCYRRFAEAEVFGEPPAEELRPSPAQPAPRSTLDRPEGQLASLTSFGDYAFTKPISVTCDGVTTPISSWRRVYQEVCRRLYESDNARMQALVNSGPISGIDWQFAISNSKYRMISPKEFVPGYYVETNLSATDTMKRICALLDYFHAADRFEIRYRSLKESAAKKTPTLKPPQPAATLVDASLESRVEALVLAADIEGITLEELSAQLPGVPTQALKQLRDHSPKLVEIADKLIHQDAFADWDEGARQLEEILEKLLAQNSGYASRAQLYEYAQAHMSLFLNDNGMDDPHKVFDLAQHLFEKLGYDGKRYSFASRQHISSGDARVSSALDLVRKFSRERRGVFRFEELKEFLERVNVGSDNLSGKMQLGAKPYFFLYSAEEIISAESLGIDEAWEEQARKAFARLFADVGDHIVLRAIDPIWYEQLPKLPGQLPWTPLLLQYILKFYGEQLGARTIGSELNQRLDVLHAMLVTYDGEIQNFADAVIAYLLDSGCEARQFEAEELRAMLVKGRLITGNELIWNMPKAIGSDPRFSWDAYGERVKINLG